MEDAPTMQEVRDALAEVYRPEGIELWMHGKNPMLDDLVPALLVELGEGERVMQIIEILKAGECG